MKEKFLELYHKYIFREGADGFINWLESTDFFTAPASTRYHGSYQGGLCQHSINVFEQLIRLLKTYKEIKTTGETAAIIALLHDVCKADCYKTEMRNTKQNGAWIQVPYYTFQEDFCYGNHGGKSVYLIGKYMRLTDEEAVAIQCHMGNEDGKYTVSNAYEQNPLAWLLHVADEAATYLDESKEEK